MTKSILTYAVMTAAMAFALTGCGSPNSNDGSSGGGTKYLSSTDPNSGSVGSGQDQGQGQDQNQQQSQQSQVCKDKSCQVQPTPMPKQEPKVPPTTCKDKNCQDQGNQGQNQGSQGQDQGSQGQTCQDAQGNPCASTSATAHVSVDVPDLTQPVVVRSDVEPMRVKFGTMITWNDADRGPVQIASDDSTFKSSPLKNGEKFSVIFNKLGTFEYHYKVDSDERVPGTVVVEP